MGIASFGGNSFYNRVLAVMTDRDRMNERDLDFIDNVPRKTVNRYTLLQFLILAVIFVITLLPYISALFPICIAVLVPLRIFKLPKWFGVSNVDQLDAEGSSTGIGAAD